jgi:serine/threonine protein kinase
MRPSPLRRTAQFSQVTGALRYMHSKRIMHRDVKPANVLVTSTGLKLGDLGLGRHFSDNTHEAFSKVRCSCTPTHRTLDSCGCAAWARCGPLSASRRYLLDYALVCEQWTVDGCVL